MHRLPAVTGNQVVRVLRRAGFAVVQQRGSHVQMRSVDAGGNRVTFPVPVHAGRTVKRGTLKGILRKAGLTAEDLRKLL